MSLAPPFTKDTAYKKVKAAQNLWNTKDPSKVVQAYTSDTIWRNRDIFLKGHEEVRGFLTAKWKREHNYRLKKELFAWGEDRIAVQFWYEYQVDPKDEERWQRCESCPSFASEWDLRRKSETRPDSLCSP